MYIKHPWHGIDPDWTGEELYGIVEIPKGESAKYEVDKNSGLIKLDRSLRGAFEYPIHYGFIPKSLGDDGDPLDILILSDVPMVPLCLVRCYVVGVMQMTDRGKMDDKIISIASSDPKVNEIKSLDMFPNYLIETLRQFFSSYTKLENKEVNVKEFLGKEEAKEIIESAFQRYSMQFGNKSSFG